MNVKTKGRLILVSIILFFALPAVVAKAVLTNHWYQSGVTNKGVLIEPRITLSSLGLDDSVNERAWHIGYVVPRQCDKLCEQHIHMLTQSHIALGKEQSRVVPLVLIAPQSDTSVLDQLTVSHMTVNEDFVAAIDHSEIVILDPLGQLVMHYPKADSSQLVSQSKNLLADLRKLLKLSRVG